MSADRINVTSHARLRWLERVSAEETYPAGAIRNALRRGADFRMGAIDAVADEETETVLLCHRNDHETVVVTVLTDAIRRYWGEGQ